MSMSDSAAAVSQIPDYFWVRIMILIETFSWLFYSERSRKTNSNSISNGFLLLLNKLYNFDSNFWNHNLYYSVIKCLFTFLSLQETYGFGTAPIVAFPIHPTPYTVPWQPTTMPATPAMSATLPPVGSLVHHTPSPAATTVYKEAMPVSRSPCAIATPQQQTSSSQDWKWNELNSIGSQPLFNDLQTALQDDCAKVTVPSTLLDMLEGPAGSLVPVPITVKITTLQLRFTLLSSRFHSRVEDLEAMYRMQATEIETERYRTLCQMQDVPWMHNTINQRYNQHHLALIARIESSLELLEKKKQQQDKKRRHKRVTITVKPETASTSCDHSVMPEYKPYQKHNNFIGLNPVAVRIMTNWYQRNQEHPYPSYDTCEIMAKASNLDVEQVKKWFANKRRRDGNTKTLTNIASRRKRTRTESTEILLQGVKRSRE